MLVHTAADWVRCFSRLREFISNHPELLKEPANVIAADCKPDRVLLWQPFYYAEERAEMTKDDLAFVAPVIHTLHGP